VALRKTEKRTTSLERLFSVFVRDGGDALEVPYYARGLVGRFFS